MGQNWYKYSQVSFEQTMQKFVNAINEEQAKFNEIVSELDHIPLDESNKDNIGSLLYALEYSVDVLKALSKRAQDQI